IDNFLNEKRNEQIRNEIRERNQEKKLLQSNEASASQAQNSYSDSSPKSYDELHPLIEELRIEPLVEDTIKVVNVDKNSTDKQSLAIELVHLFKKISLAENNTKRAK
ncbi:3164_t:CDS:2, partial [Diversispora eburnea]